MRPAALCVLLSALATACGARSAVVNQTAPTPDAGQSPATSQSATEVPKSATCALLSSEDIKAVQGEEVADSQGSEHLTGALVTSQCFYRLPTLNKSVSIEVTRPATGATPGAIAELWRKSFGREAVEERERAREREEQAGREREQELERERAAGQVREGGHPKESEEGEGKEGGRPVRVAGLGDEAYWSGGGSSAALSVLKKGAIIRVAVGGDEERDAKIKKAKALAQKILKHF